MNDTILTSRQQEIYEFLREKIMTRGYGPTVREIGQRFEIKSPNGVMCHLKALEKKGLISRESHMSRAIQLAKSPRQSTELPLAGTLTIGEVLPTVASDARLDFSRLYNSAEHCCYRVSGISLQSALIDDGDVLIVRRQPTFDSGQLAVVVHQDGTTGLHRLFEDGQRIRLESVLNGHLPQVVDRIIVIGVVIATIRQY